MVWFLLRLLPNQEHKPFVCVQFIGAIATDRAEGLNKASNALFEKATQGNVTAMIYYLKVRDRENWGENQPESLREIPPMQIVLTGV